MTKLDGSLQDIEKRYKATSDSVDERTRQVEENMRTSLQATKANEEALKAL